MATVEVLPAVREPSKLIGEHFQGLTIGSQVDMQKAHPSQDGNCIDSSEAHKMEGKVSSNLDVQCASNCHARNRGYYSGGYNPPANWEDFNKGSGFDAMRVYPGVQGENSSVMYFASGYGYPHQQSYGTHPPGAYLHNTGAGGQGYGPQAFQFPGQIYQNQIPPGIQYYSCPPFVTGHEGALLGPGKPGTGFSRNGVPYKNIARGRKNGFQRGSSSQGGSMMAAVSQAGQDARSEHDKARAGVACPSDLTGREELLDAAMEALETTTKCLPTSNQLTDSTSSLQSPESQALPASDSSGTLVSGTHAKQPSALPRTGFNSNNGVRGGHGAGLKSGKVVTPAGVNWRAADRVKQQGECNRHIAVANGTVTTWNDQWRRPKPMKFNGYQLAWQTSQNGHHESYGTESIFQKEPVNREQYNREDFETTYVNAKFYIIKSYSEDDVHKSIKYNVWSSTPNGNKKLDGAYQEAQETAGGEHMKCPLFFFFSVNSSGQFCGVAEMVGPVDFNKNMDFWLQGKWNGCFPVKWHIVKDVPNSQFRHIILSNNDNKPVTHSRDTQEVSILQGIEMLKIYKGFPLKTSLLDDFAFYDGREKVLQERKLRQRAHQQVVKIPEQGIIDNKTCKTYSSEALRDGDQGNRKPDELDTEDLKSAVNSVEDKSSETKESTESSLENASEISEGKFESTLENDSSSVPDSGQISETKGDLPARIIDYKKALMVGVEEKRNVVEKAVTI